FSQVLEELTFDEEVVGWVTVALRESHADEKEYHDREIARLQGEYRKLQNRCDAMYTDKLDGRIDNDYFDRKAAEWQIEQDRLLRNTEQHQKANKSYFDEGIRILELARKASGLFKKQSAQEKRRLLNFLLSNSTWKDGKLSVTYRQPFDIIAKSAVVQKEKEATYATSPSISDIWLLE
ncbi:MAG: recombinase family protein, partial [Proteobacteria bacterium]|nr:recombinase family protein [Pseudomonadota bacterium]